MTGSTIYALSSGQLPSGVAVIRISGPDAPIAMEKMLGRDLLPRRAVLCDMRHPETAELIDTGLCIWFPGPASFTGEDTLELQGHGGVASVSALLDALSALDGYRMAEAGEFSRRAFENGRLDLTELEGLSDLVAAQTEAQRRQAVTQAGGKLRELYEGWRSELIRIRSHLEAEMDFADEGDVDDILPQEHENRIQALREDILRHLNDGNRGQIVRDGLRVALAGPPNAGKSSVLNALAKRDIAIVTPHAGTTRDIVEVQLDIDGHLVIVSDTAGIRRTDDDIERLGIEKSRAAIETADLVFWLEETPDGAENAPDHAIRVQTKTDLGRFMKKEGVIMVNTVEINALDPLISAISTACKTMQSHGEALVISRKRYRENLEICVKQLDEALSREIGQDIVCEHLRAASDSLGRITGKIDVEDLLDVIFSDFCIGK